MFKRFRGVDGVLRLVLIGMCVLSGLHEVAAAAGVAVSFLAWVPSVPECGMMFMLGEVIVAPFPVDAEQTAISLAYRNTRLIADGVLPRTTVGKQNFKYNSYDKGVFLTIPNTAVSRKGIPNEVELGFTEIDSSCKDEGLDDVVPNDDITNAPDGYNPLGAATEFLTDLIMLRREARVASLVFDTNQYAAANKATLSGSSQFSHASSTPIKTIENAIAACFIRPNKVVMGRDVWKETSQHADIVSATYKNSGTKGKAKRQDFAELFELDECLVGEGWYNIAKPGQTPSLVRVWGKSMLLFYSNPLAKPQMGLTFGLTAQWQTRVSGNIAEPKTGLRGSVRVRVGESVREVIMCPDCAFLLDAAVA